MTEIIEPPPGFEPGTYGLRNAGLCKESQALKCGAAQNADTSENGRKRTEIKFTVSTSEDFVFCVVPAKSLAATPRAFGFRTATEADLEAAGYISLAEHVRIVDELLNRHEASNG